MKELQDNCMALNIEAKKNSVVFELHQKKSWQLILMIPHVSEKEIHEREKNS